MTSGPTTIGDVLEAAAHRGTGGLHFITGERHSWADAAARAAGTGAALTAAGIRSGDRVVILLPNAPDIVDMFLGAVRIGAIPVPVSVDLRGDLLRRMLAEIDPALVVTDAGQDGRDELRGRRVVDAAALPCDAPHGTARAPAYRARSAEPAFMMLTSGTTTGRSKVVVYSHAAALQFSRAAVRNAGYGPGDVVYTCLPLVHGAALMCEFLGGMLAGATVVVASRFSVSRYWDHIADHGVTKTNTLGSMTALLLQAPPHPHERDHCLRLVRRSGIGAELTVAFEKRFGVPTTEMYGLNDAGLIIGLPPGEQRLGSCGVVLPEWEVRLVEPDGRDVADGTGGELLVRPVPPGVLPLGYLGADPPYGDALRDGWFATGDILVREPDGYFSFLGRRKDVIRRAGENIAPADVEEVVLAFPGIAEAAAYAVPSTLGEDEVMVSVVRAEPAGAAVDIAAMRAFCEERLPHYAVPRYVRVLPALPRTATQKVRLAELRSTGVTDDTVDAGPTSRTALAGKETSR